MIDDRKNKQINSVRKKNRAYFPHCAPVREPTDGAEEGGPHPGGRETHLGLGTSTEVPGARGGSCRGQGLAPT